jgi:hypothetical protein
MTGITLAVVSLLSMAIFAQEIGHLGIESDPTPLVQARKASKRRNPSSAATSSKAVGTSPA